MTQSARVREIRVHGVSGTPPHSMLGVHDYEVEQVSGDDITGLFRCRDGVSPRGVTVPQDVEVVAYSWGALTSGASGFLGGLRRAMWLTLLPFALGNLSYWARPDLDERGGTRAATAVAVREACLILTVLFTSAMCLIGMDMIAWQCFRGGTPVCPSLPQQLSFLGRQPWDAASIRILIGSVLPLAMLGVLWWLSRASLARYEAQESQYPASGGSGVLSRRRMWAGDRRTTLLQRLHIAAGLLVVVLFGVAPALRYAPRTVTWWLTAALAILAVVLLCAIAWAVGASFRDGVDFPGVHIGLPSRLARVVPWLAVLAVLGYAGLMVTLEIPESFDDGGLTQGRNTAVGIIIAILILVVAWLVFASDGPVVALWLPLALICAGAVALRSVAWGLALGLAVVLAASWRQLRRPDPGVPRAWNGAGAAVILGAAVWLAVLFTTSLVVFVGNWLNGSATVTALQADFDPSASPGAFAARVEAADQPLLLATGPVVLRDAVLERAGPDFFSMRSGSVSASSVTTADQDLIRATPALDVTSGLLLVDDPPLQVVNSCLVEVGQTCQKPVDTWLYTVGGPLTIAGPVSIVVDTVPQEPIVVPQVLVWASGLTVVWVIGVGLVVLICTSVFVRNARAAVRVQVGADGIGDARQRRSARARTLAGFTHRAEPIIGWVGVVTSLIGVFLLVAGASGWQPWRVNEVAAALVNSGLWLAMLLSASVILLVAKLMSATGFWRVVGVLWDLTTFWPRVAHPLGPPCYAERVVPEIVDEVMGSPDSTRVILSGHSQGSLIAVAVLSQVASVRGTLESLRFVCYGSQLRTWYGRIFPAVLGPQILGTSPMPERPGLSTAVPDAPDSGMATSAYPLAVPAGSLAWQLGVGSPDPRWVALFRRTDPIGFRVFSDQSSTVDRYTSEYDPAGDALLTHSEYQFSSVYASIVQKWY